MSELLKKIKHAIIGKHDWKYWGTLDGEWMRFCPICETEEKLENGEWKRVSN